MSAIRWISAAFMTLVWAPSDWAWRRSLRKRVSLAKARPGFDVPVAQIDIGDGGAWADTCVAIAMDLEEKRSIETVRAATNGGHGALVWDTAEWPIVYVSLDRRTPRPRRPVSLRKRVTLVRRMPRLRRDALGAWDPSTVDWSEPALYHETAYDMMPALGRMVPEAGRLALAASIADYAMALNG